MPPFAPGSARSPGHAATPTCARHTASVRTHPHRCRSRRDDLHQPAAALPLRRCHRCARRRWLYFRHAGHKPGARERSTIPPRAPVQLPMYNERYVVERLIDAVCRARLPARPAGDPGAGRLDRRDAAASRARAWSASARKGVDIALHPPRQPPRLQGGRAGARARSCHAASSSPSSTPTSCPAPDFLQRTVPLLRRRRRSAWCRCAGATSTATTRILTQAQAHLPRRPLHHRAHRAQPLAAASSTSTAPPASGGASAIEDAGGWQHDTLTEDLDLSLPRAARGLAVRLPARGRRPRPRCRWT